MIIMTRKRYKKEQAIVYGAVGASGVLGATATTIGAIALAKACKAKSDVDNLHTDMERRMAAEEGMSKQFNRAIAQMQNVLEKNDMLRVKL